jgi:hypothetical protein
MARESKFLERVLDLLERVEVPVEHPLDQVGEELEPVAFSRLARTGVPSMPGSIHRA